MYRVAALLLLIVATSPALADDMRLVPDQRTSDACAVAPLAPVGRLVVVGVERGLGLSNVALGVEDGEVGVALVVIEPGREPLHLVLTSREALIWIVSGEVDRVATVLANASESSGGAPRVGIIGISAEKVHVAAIVDCFPSFYSGSFVWSADAWSGRWTEDRRTAEASRPTVDAIERLTGRRADQVVAKIGFSMLYLPSARVDHRSLLPSAIELPLLSRGLAIWQEFAWHRPGGLIRIDPKKIVSRLAPKPYEVLPGDAGFAQLLDEGALEVVESSEATYAGSDGTVLIVQSPWQFRITRKIRVPPSLAGRHLLGPGAPLPDGDLSRLCLISETTGESFGGNC
jgi:hypothetical protein